MNEPEEQDALWELLGRATPRQASPYFARKAVRAALAEPDRGFSWALLWRWLVPASAVAALIIGLNIQQDSHQQSIAEFNAYFDSAAGLDQLVTSTSDISSWVAGN